MPLNKTSSQSWIITSKCAVRSEVWSIGYEIQGREFTKHSILQRDDEMLALKVTWRSAASGLCGDGESAELSFQRRPGTLPSHAQNIIIKWPGHLSPQVHSRSKHSSSLPLKNRQKRPLGISNEVKHEPNPRSDRLSVSLSSAFS